MAAERVEDGAVEIVLERVSRLVHSVTGVQLGLRQRAMVESRMKKRILELRMSSFNEYLKYLDAEEKNEVPRLVSILTTHHTYFFRESYHFEFIEKNLPAIVASVRARGQKNLRILCAACSRGHEVYSVAAFMTRHLKTVAPDLTFSILGTDVDAESVAISRNGVYDAREIKNVPAYYQDGVFIKGQGEVEGYVKIRKSVHDRCEFKTSNLTDRDLGYEGLFDLILCRNVFIYFSPAQIEAATANLIKSLAPRGYLFIGISESLNGLNLPVSLVGSSVYQRESARTAPPAAVAPAKGVAKGAPPLTVVPSPAMPLRVLCVDDSSSILTLLSKILIADRGFEIVGTAKNGREAAEFLLTHKIDVMTLDIHMPEMTGVEYLRRHYRAGHPPVVVISSVSREEQSLAVEALNLGAADYVEKPSLDNFVQSGDEIRSKLTCAVRARKEGLTKDNTLDRAQARTAPVITAPEKKLVLAALASVTQARSLRGALAERNRGFAPVVVLIEGIETTIHAIAPKLSQEISLPVQVLTLGMELKPDGVYVADLESFDEIHRSSLISRRPCVWAWRDLSKRAGNVIRGWRAVHLLVEDDGGNGAKTGDLLPAAAVDVVPVSSFGYMARMYLHELESK